MEDLGLVPCQSETQYLPQANLLEILSGNKAATRCFFGGINLPCFCRLTKITWFYLCGERILT